MDKSETKSATLDGSLSVEIEGVKTVLDLKSRQDFLDGVRLYFGQVDPSVTITLFYNQFGAQADWNNSVPNLRYSSLSVSWEADIDSVKADIVGNGTLIEASFNAGSTTSKLRLENGKLSVPAATVVGK